MYVTKPETYDEMWKKLEDYYDDTSATVQAALEDLHMLKPVSETDYRGLVEFVDVVESSYSQLEELNQLTTLTTRDIDFVNGLLPNHLRLKWIRKYYDMSQTEKIQPFKSLMKFLEREREAVARIAEYQPRRRRTLEVPKTGDRGKGLTHQGTVTVQDKKPFYQCAFHRRDTIKHKTSDCKEFQKLPISGEGGKFERLKQVNACFVCRCVPTRNHVQSVEVRSITFPCASQGKRKKVQPLPVKIKLYHHFEKKIRKLINVYMLN